MVLANTFQMNMHKSWQWQTLCKFITHLIVHATTVFGASSQDAGDSGIRIKLV